MATFEGRRFLEINGNDMGQALARDHSLKIQDPWIDSDAGWVARAVAFQEVAPQHSIHHVIESGRLVADPNLSIAWFYRDVKEHRNFLPATRNPNVSPQFAVFWPLQVAMGTGVQFDAQTVNNDPAYRMWVEGSYLGKRVVSETCALGMIGDHVCLAVLWELTPLGAPTPQPQPTPSPSPSPFPAISAYADQILSAASAIKAITRQ